MSDKIENRYDASRSIDLSTGKKGKKKVTDGMAAPVVQETIDLSTPKKKKKKEVTPSAEKPKQPRSKKKASKSTSSRKRKPRGGASLAELLDPETLARLKGERASKDVDS